MGGSDSWKGDFRRIYGKAVRIHPASPRAFEYEATRWRVIRDGVREVLKCVPRNERRLYTVLAECGAFADFRHERAAGNEKPVDMPLLFP